MIQLEFNLQSLSSNQIRYLMFATNIKLVDSALSSISCSNQTGKFITATTWLSHFIRIYTENDKKNQFLQVPA